MPSFWAGVLLLVSFAAVSAENLRTRSSHNVTGAVCVPGVLSVNLTATAPRTYFARETPIVVPEVLHNCHPADGETVNFLYEWRLVDDSLTMSTYTLRLPPFALLPGTNTFNFTVTVLSSFEGNDEVLVESILVDVVVVAEALVLLVSGPTLEIEAGMTTYFDARASFNPNQAPDDQDSFSVTWQCAAMSGNTSVPCPLLDVEAGRMSFPAPEEGSVNITAVATDACCADQQEARELTVVGGSNAQLSVDWAAMRLDSVGRGRPFCMAFPCRMNRGEERLIAYSSSYGASVSVTVTPEAAVVARGDTENGHFVRIRLGDGMDNATVTATASAASANNATLEHFVDGNAAPMCTPGVCTVQAFSPDGGEVNVSSSVAFETAFVVAVDASSCTDVDGGLEFSFVSRRNASDAASARATATSWSSQATWARGVVGGDTVFSFLVRDRLGAEAEFSCGVVAVSAVNVTVADLPSLLNVVVAGAVGSNPEGLLGTLVEFTEEAAAAVARGGAPPEAAAAVATEVAAAAVGALTQSGGGEQAVQTAAYILALLASPALLSDASYVAVAAAAETVAAHPDALSAVDDLLAVFSALAATFAADPCAGNASVPATSIRTGLRSLADSVAASLVCGDDAAFGVAADGHVAVGAWAAAISAVRNGTLPLPEEVAPEEGSEGAALTFPGTFLPAGAAGECVDVVVVYTAVDLYGTSLCGEPVVAATNVLDVRVLNSTGASIDAQDPVAFTLPVKEDYLAEEPTDVMCVVWDAGAETYSPDECSNLAVSFSEIECECTSLGAVAALYNFTPPVYPGTGAPVNGPDSADSIALIVGVSLAGVAFVCLVVACGCLLFYHSDDPILEPLKDVRAHVLHDDTDEEDEVDEDSDA